MTAPAALRRPALFSLLVLALCATACDDNGTSPDAGSPIRSIAPANLQRLDPQLRDRVRLGAYYLALREMHRDSLRMMSEVEIDTDLITLYTNALAHVQLATNIPAADSVSGMTPFPRPEIHSLLLYAEDGTAWMEEWDRGAPTTGYAALDTLVAAWQLDLVDVTYHSWGRWTAELRSPRPVNITALAERFRPLNGMVSAGPNGFFGDGSDITASRKPDGVEMHYSVRWGDCPSGCIYRHTWTFFVAANGKVTLFSVTGSNLP